MSDIPVGLNEVRKKLVELRERLAMEDHKIGVTMALGHLEGFSQMKDVKLEQHGRWNTEPRGVVRCSVCEKGYRITNGGANVLKFSYCPNCGAKMDGGASDAVC